MVALPVPRHNRRTQSQLFRKPVHYRKTLITERCEGARRAAKLYDQETRRDFIEPLGVPNQRRKPRGNLQAETDRQRLLPVGASRQDSDAVPICKFAQVARELDESFF